MIDHRSLDELTDKIASALPDCVRLMQRDLESNLRAVLETALNKMNLVTREEFEVQTALLARLQQKISLLEQQVGEMEKNSETK